MVIEGIWPSRILQNTQSLIGDASLSRVDSGNGSDDSRPSVRVRRGAVLDTHDGVVQLLREGTGAASVDGDPFVLVGQLAHGRDDRRGAGGPGLLERAAVRRVDDLVDGDGPLRYPRAPV